MSVPALDAVPASDDAVRCRRLNTLIYADHFAASERFYREGLGLEVSFANAWFVEFTLNRGACLSVVEKGTTRLRGMPISAHTLTFEIGDIEETRETLIGRGLAPGDIHRHDFGVRVFYLRDPEGNRLEFWSRD